VITFLSGEAPSVRVENHVARLRCARGEMHAAANGGKAVILTGLLMLSPIRDESANAERYKHRCADQGTEITAKPNADAAEKDNHSDSNEPRQSVASKAKEVAKHPYGNAEANCASKDEHAGSGTLHDSPEVFKPFLRRRCHESHGIGVRRLVCDSIM
ncbi:MAG TPA: hypothetical protein VJ063_14575, partial [Verrucomicrobiae bacterium]|nr:hypothetical protein [Verrucomicrobiae bacterium]